MFTFIWERLSPRHRHRALYSAALMLLFAYLLLALVAEPMQSFHADALGSSSSDASTGTGET
ncbi:MAG: hypothetical protein PHZ00_01490 [Candidatus Peribacteraceae bacterium]|nr:hypothetical protein [Candidatus Peribacteraceae bacterium]